ncbi:Rha family transcriptional regulator [Grimontia hollisae]|uniref:Rha family transcriptional regulator n=1 Tax=Grimontia hollisae TaxID=673 RepID=UPI00165DCD0F|nr:Rha family transcriptional regulator [Grimontia hollisae]
MSAYPIAPPAPFVTKKRFAEMTGQSPRAIDSMIQNGELPILPKKSRNSAALINLVALYKRSAEQAA